MDNLSEKLMEELENHTAFTIPIFGGIPVPDSCLVSWIIIAVVVLLSIILTHNMKKVPKGKQCLIEIGVEWMNNFFLDTLGHHGKKYLPILETFLIYIGFSNIIGIFGFIPPTKDINVTVALAVMASILIQIAGFKEKGCKKWAKGFLEPMPAMLPMNLLELITRPLSMSMRLFGNVLGAFVVMELIKICIPGGIPVPFSLYFDIFDGAIQAYVFVFLTSLFMAEAIEE